MYRFVAILYLLLHTSLILCVKFELTPSAPEAYWSTKEAVSGKMDCKILRQKLREAYNPMDQKRQDDGRKAPAMLAAMFIPSGEGKDGGTIYYATSTIKRNPPGIGYSDFAPHQVKSILAGAKADRNSNSDHMNQGSCAEITVTIDYFKDHPEKAVSKGRHLRAV